MTKLRTSSLKVGRVIHTELSDIAPCFAIVAENGTKFPFITWRRTALSCIDTKDFYNVQETATMVITIAATTYAESLQLAQAVKIRLDHRAGRKYETETEDPIYIDEIRLTNASEDYVDGAYVQILTFDVKMSKECC